MVKVVAVEPQDSFEHVLLMELLAHLEHGTSRAKAGRGEFGYGGGRMHLKTFKEVPNAAP